MSFAGSDESEPPPSWREVLRRADTSHEVVALASEFLDRLGPSNLELLSHVCRPPRLVDAVDVNAYAVDLKHAMCREVSQAEVVSRTWGFFQEASARLIAIAALAHPLPRAGVEAGQSTRIT